MENYVSFKDIPLMWGIKEGDVVYVSSDVSRLFKVCQEHGELFGYHDFIDAIIKVVGKEGTVLFPTFNWDFCHDIPFNYKKTMSQTGILGHVAMKRPDFKRTKHPIYSFAVYGKDQDLLCNMDNVSSFGQDSPFAYLEKVKAHNILVDVPYIHCFTFMHYIEQKVGVTYRYEKMFTGDYIDENKVKQRKSYSMYVRNLDLDVVNDMTEMGNLLDAKRISILQIINGIEFRNVDLAACVPLFEDDIKNNRSKKICKFKGQ